MLQSIFHENLNVNFLIILVLLAQAYCICIITTHRDLPLQELNIRKIIDSLQSLVCEFGFNFESKLRILLAEFICVGLC